MIKKENITQAQTDNIYLMLGEQLKDVKDDKKVKSDLLPAVLMSYGQRLEQRAGNEYGKWLDRQKMIAAALGGKKDHGRSQELSKSDKKSSESRLEYDCRQNIIKNKTLIEKAYVFIQLAFSCHRVACLLQTGEKKGHAEYERQKESCRKIVHKCRAFVTEKPEDVMKLATGGALVFDRGKEAQPGETRREAAERERREMRPDCRNPLNKKKPKSRYKVSTIQL